MEIHFFSNTFDLLLVAPSAVEVILQTPFPSSLADS